MAILFVLGYFGFLNIKTTLLPEIEFRLITIQVIYPGSSPAEIEEGVITKVEEELKGISGIERTTSVCSENVAWSPLKF